MPSRLIFAAVAGQSCGRTSLSNLCRGRGERHSEIFFQRRETTSSYFEKKRARYDDVRDPEKVWSVNNVLLVPQLDQPRYTIQSSLFGTAKANDNEFAGWWMPMNGSSIVANSGAGWQRSMTLIFATQTRAAFASGGSTLTVNGRAVSEAWSEPQVVVPLPASGGLCWCVQPKPNNAWCGTVLPAHCVNLAR